MNITEKLSHINIEPNVGSHDQKIRIAGGLILLVAAAANTSIILLIISAFFLATAYYHRCPVYSKLDKNTCATAENVGTDEQNIRYGAGAVIILVAAVTGSILLLIVGALVLATAYIQWCPVYYKLGTNTSTAKKPTVKSKTSTTSQKKAAPKRKKAAKKS